MEYIPEEVIVEKVKKTKPKSEEDEYLDLIENFYYTLQPDDRKEYIKKIVEMPK
jgi:hypothetical protein